MNPLTITSYIPDFHNLELSFVTRVIYPLEQRRVQQCERSSKFPIPVTQILASARTVLWYNVCNQCKQMVERDICVLVVDAMYIHNCAIKECYNTTKTKGQFEELV